MVEEVAADAIEGEGHQLRGEHVQAVIAHHPEERHEGVDTETVSQSVRAVACDFMSDDQGGEKETERSALRCNPRTHRKRVC